MLNFSSQQGETIKLKQNAWSENMPASLSYAWADFFLFFFFEAEITTG